MSETIRFEEYHTVGTFVMGRFHVDKSEFVGFSPVYDGTFETDANAKIEAVLEIVNTKFHINKIKVVSKSIDILLGQVLPKLSLLEKYVIMAHSSIELTPREFGFIDLRKSINDGDVEAVETNFAFLIQNATTHFTALETKGFTDTAFTELKDMSNKITTKNDLQEALKSDKRHAVAANHVVFDEVLNIIKDLQDTGKRLFKFTDKEKTKDYTMSYILNQIRQENEPLPHACQLEIVVKDGSGNLLKDITGLVVEYALNGVSDVDGILLFDAVPTVPHVKVTVKLKGTGWKEKTLENVELDPDGQVSLEVVMEAE